MPIKQTNLQTTPEILFFQLRRTVRCGLVFLSMHQIVKSMKYFQEEQHLILLYPAILSALPAFVVEQNVMDYACRDIDRRNGNNNNWNNARLDASV